MEEKKEITIDKRAVSRAVRKPLENYYAIIGADGFDESDGRPGNWEENEDLFKSIYKSRYVSKHLDWLYVLELVYAVIDQNAPLKPDDFAEQLEKAIADTAGKRDYLAIVPFAFRTTFGFHLTKSPLSRPVVLGEFTLSPAALSAKALNKVIAKHKFPPVRDSDFEHAARMSNKSLSHEMLVTFNAHGAEDRLRFTTEIKFRSLCRLIEIFACLFADTSPSLGAARAANHFFLLSKSAGELRRFPTIKPLSFDFELSARLLSSIKRPEFNSFLVEISSSSDSMYGRIKNAMKFFSMALNGDDEVASFLFYVIAIESIFSRDKNNPIKITLADLCSILCFPPEQRLSAYQMIRDAYDLRSSIVHSGASFVDRKNTIKIKLIAARAIYCSLFLCKKIKNRQGSIEDNFFNHLRDRKIGIAGAIIPNLIWSLPKIGAENE